jgi:hypothetical protein
MGACARDVTIMLQKTLLVLVLVLLLLLLMSLGA